MQLTDRILYYLGTGKSETGTWYGIHISNNKWKCSFQECVQMYLHCTPSNKSVDDVHGDHFVHMSAGAMILNSIITLNMRLNLRP